MSMFAGLKSGSSSSFENQLTTIQETTFSQIEYNKPLILPKGIISFLNTYFCVGVLYIYKKRYQK